MNRKRRRKLLQQSQRSLGFYPPHVHRVLVSGDLVYVPEGDPCRPTRIARDTALHQFCRAAWRSDRAGDVAVTTLEQKRCLWAQALPGYPCLQDVVVCGFGKLVQVPLPELWFQECWPLGRMILHQLVEMAEFHWLGLLSGVVHQGQAGHVLLAGFVDGDERIRFYWDIPP